MAEVHILGQIVGGTGFSPDHKLSCKWTLRHGANWKVIEGQLEGQTQLDNPQLEQFAYWCHPVDIHLLTSGLQGWPKVELEVWRQDFYGRSSLASYGLVHIPCSADFHRLECHTWKPVGNYLDKVYSLFTSSSLRLQNATVIFEGTDRFRLQTEPSGTIVLELHIILRNFSRFGVEIATATSTSTSN